MSEISYFQYYSQRENHATNNTLLVLRHFYQESVQKLEEILGSLLDEEIAIGLDFKQQVRHSESIPDGLISQKPLNIYFEVKGSGGKLNIGQIKRHIKSIKSNEDVVSSTKILFALTPDKVSDAMIDKLSDLAKEEGIIFAAITFTDVLEALQKSCAPHETKLQDILNDYEQFLSSQNLLEQKRIGELMTVVPVRTSVAESKKFHLYYEPAKRKSKTSSKFFGLYTRKCIRYIGRVGTVVRGKLKGNKYEVEEIEFSRAGKKKLTTDENQRIVDAINTCSYYPNLKKDYRFYLFDEFEETEFHKESKYGLWGPRTFNLSQWLNYDDKKEYDTNEAAEALRGKSWE